MVRRRRQFSSTTASGVSIAYHVRGRGPRTIVFVSGYLAGRQIWNLQTVRLARQARTVVYDRRGVGDSERPDSGYGLADNMADLLAVIDAVAPGESVDLVGHSMGGFISQGFVLAHPERVRSLCLLSTAPYRTTSADFGVGIFVNEEGGPLRWDVAGLRRAIALLMPEPGFEWVRLNLAERMPDAMDPEQSVKTFQAFDGVDLRPRLAQVRPPTLVIHGEADAVVPPQVGKDLAAMIPGARFTGLEGIGHLCMLTAPERLVELLNAHWASLDSAPEQVAAT